MPDITVTKDVLWRAQIDEFGCVNVMRVTRITDDEGETIERYWRRAITPDDDLAALTADLGVAPAVANRLKAIVQAGRYPEAVARFEARKARLYEARSSPMSKTVGC